MHASARFHFILLQFSTVVTLGLAGCSGQAPAATSTSPPLRAVASIQELMQTIVDPSADGVWNAVETIQTSGGDVVHEPKSVEDWSQVRRAALTLVEGANLLMMEGRLVGARYFPAEASGALDSTQIGDAVRARRSAFNGFAVALREAGQTALVAIDDKDAVALLNAGGALDQVCEGCHLTFWYPNQVIPRFPQDHDAAHPILQLGALNRKVPESIN